MKCRTLSAASGVLVMTALAAPAAQSVENEPGRIVGGTVSTSSPAAAAMYRWDSVESRMKFACTSTMLSETKVLTARHCVDGVDERFVRVGSLKHASGGTTHDIKSAVMHPGADLAVVTLATAATGAKTTELASTNPTKGDTNTLYGWGRTSYSSGPSPDLKQTNVPVTSTTSTDFYGGSGIRDRRGRRPCLEGRLWWTSTQRSRGTGRCVLHRLLRKLAGLHLGREVSAVDKGAGRPELARRLHRTRASAGRPDRGSRGGRAG